MAAWISSAGPPKECNSWMVPSLEMIAARCTTPDTRADLANCGYTGGVFFRIMAPWTLPPTLMRCTVSTSFGAAAGGGGGGGGAAVGTAPMMPPNTPPTAPPATPPDTPPTTPTTPDE